MIEKWKFAIGTTSRVPGGGASHYLIADFDSPIPRAAMRYVDDNCQDAIIQKTPHGWHLYTNEVLDFDHLYLTLVYIGADPAWREIGRSRGYYFLADKDKINFPWPVEHMVLNYGEKTETCDTERTGPPLREKNHH